MTTHPDLPAFLTRWQSAGGAERVKSKAEADVRSIPNDNPPFLVVKVGYSFEIYADFSGLGKIYTPFPDNLSHRFKLTDLAHYELATACGGEVRPS